MVTSVAQVVTESGILDNPFGATRGAMSRATGPGILANTPHLRRLRQLHAISFPQSPLHAHVFAIVVVHTKVLLALSETGGARFSCARICGSGGKASQDIRRKGVLP